MRNFNWSQLVQHLSFSLSQTSVHLTEVTLSLHLATFNTPSAVLFLRHCKNSMYSIILLYNDILHSWHSTCSLSAVFIVWAVRLHRMTAAMHSVRANLDSLNSDLNCWSTIKLDRNLQINQPWKVAILYMQQMHKGHCCMLLSVNTAVYKKNMLSGNKKIT